MSEMTRLLDELEQAVVGGRHEAVMAALGDAVVEVVGDGELPRVLTGDQRDEAVGQLLAGFDQIAVTLVSRTTKPTTVSDNAVLSGLQVGTFAGAEPTGERVRINISATALAAADGGVARLSLVPDLRALWTQIGDSSDSLGTASALMATIRENEARATLEWEPDAAHGASLPAQVPPNRGRRRGRSSPVLVLAAVAGVLVVAVIGWRWLDHDPSTVVQQARAQVTPAAATPTTARPTAPATRAPVATVPPVIATEAPTAVPRVQAGRQLVLTSDVLFRLGSAELTPAARKALQGLAAQIREADVSGTIQVNGYTDDLGTPASNVALSRARALAVARSLQPALAGMAVTLRPQGFGEADPVASNAGPGGRAKNRRVAVVLPRS